MRTYNEDLAYRRGKINKLENKTAFIIATIFVAFGAFLMLFPYFYMIITSLKDPKEMMSTSSILSNFWPKNPNWDMFRQVLTDDSKYQSSFRFLDSIKNTLIIEVLVVPIGTFFSTLAAFAFAKMNFKFKNGILIVLLISMMIPYAAVMLPQFRAFSDIGLVNTLWPLIIPGFFGNTGMMLFLITSMKNNIPNSLIEESRVEGAGWFRTFIKVAVPLNKAPILAQMLFWFVGIWNDFFGPSIYLTDPSLRTIQVSIMTLNSDAAMSSDTPFLMGASFMASLPIIVLFILMNKSFVQTNANEGIKG